MIKGKINDAVIVDNDTYLKEIRVRGIKKKQKKQINHLQNNWQRVLFIILYQEYVINFVREVSK